MTTKEPVAVQRYEPEMFSYSDFDMFARPEGGYVTFEDYQRDIAAAERRGAEKAIEAAAKTCADLRHPDGEDFECGNWADGIAQAENAIRSLSIEQILKGE